MQKMIMQDPDEIIFKIKNHTGYITLNRPRSLNALSLSMIRALSRQLKLWQTDPDIQQVMILSSSLNAFCAGGDLKALYQIYQQYKNQPHLAIDILEKFFEEEYALNVQVKHFKKPYIALINGISMGGGLGISLHGRTRIALNNLILSMPETTIGYFTDAGSSYFLSRLPGELGTYMALTSARLNAAEALSVGLIDSIIGEPPVENDLLQHQDIINHCFQYDNIEKILAALLKNNSAFALSAYHQLLTKSPTSLKLNLYLLRQVKNKDFDSCVEAEYNLALYFLRQPDFCEGIRAAVIDKDKQPLWSPKKFSEIDLKKINIL